MEVQKAISRVEPGHWQTIKLNEIKLIDAVFRVFIVLLLFLK